MQSNLDEEFNRFLQEVGEERERLRRLRAEREREELRVERATPAPIPQWPTHNPKYMTVKETGHLLSTGRPPSLYCKSNDTRIRDDVIKSFTPYDIMTGILRWAREGRVHLLHPTLMIIIRHPDDLDENWGVGREMFEHIKRAMDNDREPAVLPAYEGLLVDDVDADVDAVDPMGAGASIEMEEERRRRLQRERQARWRAKSGAKKNEAAKRQQPPSRAIEGQENALANGCAAPTVIMPPIQGGDGEATTPITEGVSLTVEALTDPAEIQQLRPIDGYEAAPSNQAEAKKTTRRGGRKPGSGEIKEDKYLVDMVGLLASKKSPSKWDAARQVMAKESLSGGDSTQRRLSRKFKNKFAAARASGKTWEAIERELNGN